MAVRYTMDMRERVHIKFRMTGIVPFIGVHGYLLHGQPAVSRFAEVSDYRDMSL